MDNRIDLLPGLWLALMDEPMPKTEPPIDMLERDERAAEAKALLDNPLLQEVFQRMEAEATEQLLRAEPGTVVAVAHHQRIMAIRALHAELIRVVEDPKTLRAAQERRRRFSQ